MNITVFGATGRTGVPLVEQALAAGHEVTAFVRDPTKLDVDHDRLTVVEGDAYTGSGVEEAVKGADAVCSVLGQTSNGPRTTSSQSPAATSSTRWSRPASTDS